MFNVKRIFSVVLLGLISSASNAYDPATSHPNAAAFDTTQLADVADDTIGESQRLLDQRGSVECIKCHVPPTNNYQGVIDTVDIIDSTMSAALSCMDWEVRGACVWVTCIGPVCAPNVSVKVKNFVPDLIMQSYDRANGEPWTESQDINRVSQADAESSWVMTMIGWVESFDVDSIGIEGGVSTQGSNKKKAGLMFKLVDAYGNPALVAFNALGQGTFGMVCSGRSWPLFPYYVSNLDAIAWRWDIPEMFYPQSLIPLFTNWSLGTWSNNYGPIYPRHGFLHQEDDLKAAVLTTFRAGHFITRNNEPHLYMPVSPTQEDGYWPSDPLDHNDSDTGRFQMLYPHDEDSCEAFPYSVSPSSNRRSDDGSYVWNFWKSYKCCQRVGDALVWHSG